MQMVGLPEQLLNMSDGIETEEALGLGLGVGPSLLMSGSTSTVVDGGEPLAWGLASGGSVGDGGTSQLASTMSLVGRTTINHKNTECGGSQEPKGVVEKIKEKVELWKIKGMEGLQAVDESCMPESVVTAEEEKCGVSESEKVKVQECYNNDGESGQPKASENKLDGSCEVPHVDWNITSVKGSAMLHVCTECTQSATANVMNDHIICAACGKSHCCPVMSGGDSRVLPSILDMAATIKACAGRCLSLCQDFKTKASGSFEQAVFVRGCIDALGHNAKAMLVTVECLEFLQKSNECSQHLERLENELPPLVSQDELVRLDGKMGLSSLTFLSEACSRAPFSSTKLGVHQVAFCAMDRDNSLNGQKQKRKRTRFTFEQLKKLNDFATRTGWTLAGVHKEDIDALCDDVGIEPVTLKYWIHNTRQKSRKKLDLDAKSLTTL